MSAPTPEAVRALIARWRAEAAPHRGATGDEAEIAHAKASCADELEEAIARDAAGLLRPTTAETCTWTIDDVGGESVWVTACKREFYFDDDGSPVSNGLRWCAFCGRPLVEVYASEAAGSPLAGERIHQEHEDEDENPLTRAEDDGR